jgi:hypothetical protein
MMSTVTVPSRNDDTNKSKTGKPNAAAAGALLERYYFWLLRTGKIAFAHPRRGVRGKSVSVVTAKNS